VQSSEGLPSGTPPAAGLRSRTLLAIALLLSAGLGGALGYLTRSAPSPVGPQEVRIAADGAVSDPDLRSALEARLEELISSTEPSRSPAAAALVRSLGLAARRDPATASWLTERIGEPDVPEVLLTDLLGELGGSRVGEAVVHGLVTQRLASESKALRTQGVRLVRALRLGRTQSSGRCACEGGVFPAEPGAAASGGARWAVAWTLQEGGFIRWNPTRSDVSGVFWTLGLEATDANSGATNLLFRIDEVNPHWTLALEAEGGPRIPL
jgi:hypothetical protein